MPDTLANPVNIDTSDLEELPTGNDSSTTTTTTTRHVLEAEEELRLEVPFLGTKQETQCTLCLRKGSCEVWGVELAVNKPYRLEGGFKAALFTWHGCVVDVSCDHLDISYTSQETACNVAYVNTHAQLEALRDEAMKQGTMGPRVLIMGPSESGKSSLTKTLVSYATKLGRAPLWIDLDPNDNSISVPGTLAAVPMTGETVTVEQFVTGGIPVGTTPLVLFHGSTTLQPELFKAQGSALAAKTQQRLLENPQSASASSNSDDDTGGANTTPGAMNSNSNIERSSGIIINTNGWIQDEGFELLLHTVDAMDISVVLIMGHDRLYSLMTNHFKKHPEIETPPKIIKLPRSGGTVSREAPFLRQAKSRSMKRYFYGDMVDPPQPPSGQTSSNPVSLTRVPQLTPFLNQIQFGSITLYKLSSMSLSSSLLPVAQQQSTDSIQVQQVELSEALQHALLAVCHPLAVAAYQQSGRARDLYESGVAGFCAVERVVMDTEIIHLLCPCAGSLPSQTLLIGDITWME